MKIHHHSLVVVGFLALFVLSPSVLAGSKLGAIQTADEFLGTVVEQLYDRLHVDQAVETLLPSEVEPVGSVEWAAPIDSSQPFAPFDDFSAFLLPNGSACFLINRPGIYYVLVNGISEYMVHVLADPGEAGGQQAQARYTSIPDPVGMELLLVETQVPGDNCFDDGCAAAVSGEQRHATVAAVCNAINAAYTANGNQPIDVWIAGHGNIGLFTMGGGQAGGAQTISAADIGNGGSNTEAFIACCRGKVSTLTLFGCNVGRGATGTAFLKDLANAIKPANNAFRPTVSAYDRTVCANKGGLFGWGAGLSVQTGATLNSQQADP